MSRNSYTSKAPADWHMTRCRYLLMVTAAQMIQSSAWLAVQLAGPSFLSPTVMRHFNLKLL